MDWSGKARKIIEWHRSTSFALECQILWWLGCRWNDGRCISTDEGVGWRTRVILLQVYFECILVVHFDKNFSQQRQFDSGNDPDRIRKNLHCFTLGHALHGRRKMPYHYYDNWIPSKSVQKYARRCSLRPGCPYHVAGATPPSWVRHRHYGWGRWMLDLIWLNGRPTERENRWILGFAWKQDYLTDRNCRTRRLGRSVPLFWPT